MKTSGQLPLCSHATLILDNFILDYEYDFLETFRFDYKYEFDYEYDFLKTFRFDYEYEFDYEYDFL